MPYKIVQTVERGQTTLVIVPFMWEENGNLWWPPKKTQHKLTKDERSKPDKKEWKLMPCVLKRNNIRTYELAKAELSIMEENSDTDANDALRTTVLQNEEINFELMANNLTSGQDYGNVAAAVDVATTDTVTATGNDNVLQIFSTETIAFDQIFVNQKIILEKIDNIIKVQNQTLNNQTKIIQELATQSILLLNMSNELSVMKEGSSKVTLLKEVNPEDNESFSIKPICNQKELITLDQLLADKKEKYKMRRHLSFLFHPLSENGVTCAYKLLDILFTRDFLCLCSWSGGSRGNNVSKIAIKDYKNVLNFFLLMIQNWDPSYTSQDNENFFKIITKNSAQRKATKNLRKSTKRRRRNGNKNDDIDINSKRGKKNEEGEIIEIETHKLNNDANEEEKENKQIQKQLNDDATEENGILHNTQIHNKEQAVIDKENFPSNETSNDEYDIC